jgi:NAD(P)-dependent dehydrogenase (short-subunit alcohol dehydrogenase family)
MTGLVEGKVAVITGAAQGIGRAAAELFVQEGARVIIADMNAELGEAFQRELNEGRSSPVAWFVKSDVSNADDCKRIVDASVEKFGTINVLFNNAGIQVSSSSISSMYAR